MAFDSIASIIEDLRLGRMVIIVDDEDRENEGDLVMAAEKVRPEDINFMIKEARGLLCLPVTESRAVQLGLAPMVNANQSPYHTNFTVSIDPWPTASARPAASPDHRRTTAATAASRRWYASHSGARWTARRSARRKGRQCPAGWPAPWTSTPARWHRPHLRPRPVPVHPCPGSISPGSS